jgi:hypothetical protein
MKLTRTTTMVLTVSLALILAAITALLLLSA